MISKASKHERIHAMDSLRAIMMMLGLVLHSALTYAITDYGRAWSLKDPNSTNIIMDWLSAYIHVFRMPLFFIVAGFFGALLFYKRGGRKMIRNRVSRILFPFIVFILLLWPTIVFTFTFTRGVFSGAADPWGLAIAPLMGYNIFTPGSTFHLWFLYYLLLITFSSFGMGLLLKKMPKVSKRIISIFDPIIQYPFLKLLIFSGLTFIMLYIMGDKWVATSTSFVPDLKTFIFYSFFYIFGWILYKSRQPLEQLKDLDWLFTILGTVLLTLRFIFSNSFSQELIMAFNAVSVWSLSFGFTGLFIRYGSNHSARMRYISDSSYWVYLLHLSLTAIIPGLISDWNIPAIMKFLVVLSLTTTICFVSYHYFVRATFIGEFLNGRKYPKSTKIKMNTSKAA
jgi:fucose 4-O-acetylase-like acetyltransferase